MARVVKSSEGLEELKEVESIESEIQEESIKKSAPKKRKKIKKTQTETVKVEMQDSDKYYCHGLFMYVPKENICFSYANGKYSKEFLAKKGIPCRG